MEKNVCYSQVPAVQDFLSPDGFNSSRLNTIRNALLESQMNLSRIIMYGECGGADINDEYITYIRQSMSVNADIYNILTNIDESCKQFVAAMDSIKQ